MLDCSFWYVHVLPLVVESLYTSDYVFRNIFPLKLVQGRQKVISFQGAQQIQNGVKDKYIISFNKVRQ